VGAAGEADVSVLAVFAAGEHGQAGADGAALCDVPGDGVAEFGVFVVGEQELSVGPAAPPGFPVGVEGAADEEAPAGDGVDAEQVTVGEHPSGFSGFGVVVVAGAHDQVTAARPPGVGDGNRPGVVDQAAANQAFPDAAGQFPAQGVVGRDQQRVGAVGGQGRVVDGGGLGD
jgi:hypothetical protein